MRAASPGKNCDDGGTGSGRRERGSGCRVRLMEAKSLGSHTMGTIHHSRGVPTGRGEPRAGVCSGSARDRRHTMAAHRPLRLRQAGRLGDLGGRVGGVR